MRAVIPVLMLLFPPWALSCVIFEELPPEIAAKDPAARQLYSMQKRFQFATAVFEGTVISTTHDDDEEYPTLRANLRVGKVWKTDGGDLSVVTTEHTSCGASLHVGVTYVIFAGRIESFWSFLPWVDEPLGTGLHGAVWIGPYNDVDPDELAFHQWYSLEPLAVVLNEPNLARTPSN